MATIAKLRLVLAACWLCLPLLITAEEALPENLAAKVKELAPDATVRRVQQRERRGENYLRVDLTLPGDKDGRIEFKADGTLQDVRLELDEAQLPEPVKKALAELYPQATFDNADRNLNDGKLVIDVEYKRDGRTLTATLADDGKVIDREDELNLVDLPPAAQAALARDFPGATVSRIRRVLRDGNDILEVRVERRLSVQLPDPAGSTTTTREVPAAELPEATRAAAQAATGRDPDELTIVQHTTSAVTVYSIEINDRRDLQFDLAGVLLNPPEQANAMGAAAAPVQDNGRQNGPGANPNRGGRGNGPGNGNNNNRDRGGNGAPGQNNVQGDRGQERPARGNNPAPQENQPAAPAEEVF